MFTGIIQGTFPVSELENKNGLTRFAVALTEELLLDLKIGASVSVNGVCLTVTQIEGHNVYFDIIAETLKVTTLKFLKLGVLVNIERSLKFGDELGGHLLSGHVDTTVIIIDLKQPENNYLLTLQVDAKFMEYILPKGYVGLHGASLTIVSPDSNQNSFQVSLIPETLRLTNLKNYLIGDELNLEIDRQTQTIVSTVKAYLDQNQ